MSADHTAPLRVSLANPMQDCSGNKTIRIAHGPIATLDISLRRTVRVPDNGNAYNLPPDCGEFPIYAVSQFKDKLPQNMVSKGGLFVPIYGECLLVLVCFYNELTRDASFRQ